MLSYDVCSTIIHALISCRLDYYNYILYNFPRSKTDRLQTSEARVSCQNHRAGNILLQFGEKIHWLKIPDRIIYTIFMLTYKSCHSIAPSYLCELINKKRKSYEYSFGNHLLLCRQLVRIVRTLFLNVHAASCEWNKYSEHIRTSNFDCFRKSVKTMLFTQQYGC